MEEIKKVGPTPVSGETANDELVQLKYENTLLKNKLQEAYKNISFLSDNRGIERLKFLFRIVEAKDGVFTPEIVAAALGELEFTMFPKDNEETKDE